MKKFLNITAPYRFEWQDLRAAATVIYVILLVLFEVRAAWFGLVVAFIGIIKDCANKNRHLNDFVLHGATAILNLCFLTLL